MEIMLMIPDCFSFEEQAGWMIEQDKQIEVLQVGFSMDSMWVQSEQGGYWNILLKIGMGEPVAATDGPFIGKELVDKETQGCFLVIDAAPSIISR